MRNSTEIKAELEKIQNAGIRMNRLQNEGGEGYDHTDRKLESALIAELIAADFAENWNLEQTKENRIIWNAACTKAGKSANLVGLQKATGIRFLDLKKSIAFHNL